MVKVSVSVSFLSYKESKAQEFELCYRQAVGMGSKVTEITFKGPGRVDENRQPGRDVV